MDYLKNLAGDLLTLEVNTIVKENTTSSKMPANKRYALLSIANSYRDLLINYGVSRLSYKGVASSADDDRTVLYWRFGGEFSFTEIYKCANHGIELLRKRIEAATDLASIQKMESQIRMLQRVSRHTSNFIGMFKARRKRLSQDEIAANTKLTSDPAFETLDTETATWPSQAHQHQWNNDLSLADINTLPDIELGPDEITLLRKTWEIGTQQILMQSVIQIDGDIANYLATSFISLPPEMRKMVMSMHNESTRSATRLWQTLFRTVSQLAGKAFREIFNRRPGGADN